MLDALTTALMSRLQGATLFYAVQLHHPFSILTIGEQTDATNFQTVAYNPNDNGLQVDPNMDDSHPLPLLFMNGNHFEGLVSLTIMSINLM